MTFCAWCARELLGDPEDYAHYEWEGEQVYFCCDGDAIHFFFKKAPRVLRERDRKRTK